MSPEDITQISLGKYRVGITGLKEAIEEVRALGEQSDEDIARALFVRLKPRNYIPAPAREEYKRAFLREYKKALGEPAAVEHHGLSIKILGPGCPNCEALEQMVMAAAAELNLPADVEHIRDMKEIAALGVFGTPALLVNDEVKTVGRRPAPEVLRKWLREAAGKQGPAG